MVGPTGYLEIIEMMRVGFPDIQWTLEETIAEGDNVAARFTYAGTTSLLTRCSIPLYSSVRAFTPIRLCLGASMSRHKRRG
ncbi:MULTISPECIES: ester cyclase [unclassified Phyllobacterium]|uniref:ester cyclase n=1 Tax=unclassified Phyllobacterium TaxID=2638441 RepID=UPI003012F417